jgi:hypothetical protein
MLTATQVNGAVYQDVAEWVPATTHMAPGTVVVLNGVHNNEVMPSVSAYDTAVAGVVSARPGVMRQSARGLHRRPDHPRRSPRHQQ